MPEIGTALVTGSTGFIGSVLVNELAAGGIRVFCPVRTDLDNPHTISDIRGVEIIEITAVRNPKLRKELAGLRPDAIFNLASYGVHREQRDTERMLEANIDFLTSMLVLAAECGVKHFIHTGSCSEYGESQAGIAIKESHSVAPSTLYGTAKAASVLYGRAASQQLNLPFTVLRLFGVYGTGESQQRLIPYIISKLAADETVDLTPGEQVRDFLFVEDVARAFVAAVKSDTLPTSSVFNICSGIPVGIKEIGEKVADLMEKPRELLHWGARQYRADEPMWIVGENNSFVNATAWQPQVDLATGIKRMLNAAGYS